MSETKEPRPARRGGFWLGLVIGVVVGAAAVIVVGRLLWSPPFG